MLDMMKYTCLHYIKHTNCIYRCMYSHVAAYKIGFGDFELFVFSKIILYNYLLHKHIFY